MIAFVRGRVSALGENFAVLDTGSFGIKIFMPPSDLAKMSAGEETTVHTFLRVAEEVFDLYGFLTTPELDMFKMLLTVSGAGPKSALAMLSALSPSELALAVATDNYKAITKAQGVGPKLAQKIVLELKDKLKKSDLIGAESAGGGMSFEANIGDDAADALVVLGYSRAEAMSALAHVDKSLGVEERIKAALAALMK